MKAQLRRIARWMSLDVVRKPRALLEEKSHELTVDLTLLAPQLRVLNRDVFFILIGANDGVQTEEFLPVALRENWTGVMLEPHPAYFEKLARRFSGHANLQCINAAIDYKPGERLLYSVEWQPGMPVWVNGLASFDREHLLKHERFVPDIRGRIREHLVRCESFASLLALLNRDNFDILQVDTEGFDADILQMADLPHRLPVIVNFEHKHLSIVKWDEIVRLLITCGYRVAKVGQDTLAFRDPKRP